MTVKSAVSASIMFSKVIDVTHTITFTFFNKMRETSLQHGGQLRERKQIPGSCYDNMFALGLKQHM